MPCGLRKKPTSLLPKGARPYRSENAGGVDERINGPMFGSMSTTIGTAYATDDNLGCVLRVHREPCIDRETSAPKVQMATLSIQNVCKSFGSVEVVHRASIDVPDRAFVVLVGPSGCGKSTLLRLIAGLEDITSGTITIDGVAVNAVAAKDRDIAMVFQNYALYPHMTVFENMSFQMKIKGRPRKEIVAKVEEVAATLGLSPFLKHYPRQLSGGQRQRVAMGRALVREPKVFLLDEPLSNIDANLRAQLRAEIRSLQLRLRITTVYVTHDQLEAMTMGDQIVVMRDGKVEQIGTPLDVFDRPTNVFVAGFIGSPTMNLLEG